MTHRLSLAIVVAVCVVLFPGGSGVTAEHRAGMAPASVDPSTSGCRLPPSVSASIPSDMAPPISQANANCFAWQEFIALNWLASSSTCAADPSAKPADFGQPNNTAPVVWETYKGAAEVFQPQAAPPTTWCAQQPIPARWLQGRRAPRLAKTSAHGYKFLTLTSKDAGNPELKLSDVHQAFTGGAWLTDQKQLITLYEIRLNEDEFNYIDQNHLYNASMQKTWVQNPGLNLPDGTAQFSQYGNIGSIEFKASWIELDDPSQWPYFKTSQAYVVYPNAPTPKLVTVGLAGLHIIHKTEKGPQMIWATFEHVNNAPSTTDIQNQSLLPWYIFYNKSCNPQTDHYQCNANAQPPSATPENPYFPHNPPDPYNAAMQVVRENPISNTTSDNVAGLNQWIWNLIATSNPKSVFLNYQLVDVLWANNPTSIPAGSTVPLTEGDPVPNPGTLKVANSTMETYFQNTFTCLDCHASAPIAVVKQSEPVNIFRLALAENKSRLSGTKDTDAAFASDYSFLFSRAEVPPAKAKNSKSKQKPSP